jgi:hypothetical protein
MVAHVPGAGGRSDLLRGPVLVRFDQRLLEGRRAELAADGRVARDPATGKIARGITITRDGRRLYSGSGGDRNSGPAVCRRRTAG